MKKLLLIIQCLLVIGLCFGQGKKYAFGVLGGGPTITPASVSPGLLPGDTLTISGSYYQLNFKNLKGIQGKPIVILGLPGHVITSSAAFTAGEWSNCEFVKVVGLNSRNNLAPVHWFRTFCHDIYFDNCSYVNDFGKYSDKQAIQFDDKNSTAMNFNGDKSTTFYNIAIVNCTFNGFRDAVVIECGTETNRSICTDFTIEHNVFKNITNYVHLAAGAIGGTIFNLQCHYNIFDSTMADKGAYQGVHMGILNLYGNGDVAGNKFSTQYANCLRWNPLKWLGLPGYDGPVNVHDNIVWNSLSYSFVEMSNNSSGPRLKNIKCDTAKSNIYNNTVVTTNRSSYNGDWYGFICDAFTSHISLYNNVIINPEKDRPFDRIGRKNYIVSFPQGPMKFFDSANNRCYRTAAEAGLDTTNWKLTAVSPLVDAVPSTSSVLDYYGTPRPQGKAFDIGAIERIFQVMPPTNKRIVFVSTEINNGSMMVTITWSDGTVTIYQ